MVAALPSSLVTDFQSALGRQVEQLELAYANDQRPQQIKEKRRLAQRMAIDGCFDDHERFVKQVMTIEPAPYLKVVAVLHREG